MSQPDAPAQPALPPSGDQVEIAAAGYRAVVTESGGALRVLQHEGRDLVDGFEEDAMSSGGRGQLLVPWPNRIRDGRYRFDGRDLQLALTEPSRHNASHGLARWASWQVLRRDAASVVQGLRLAAQTGYPWTLDLSVERRLDADGLTVVQSATNRSSSPAPFASGSHPYLSAGPGPVDGWLITCPASERMLSDDERLLPAGREAVEGTPYDFRGGGPLGDVEVNHAFTGLARDADGRATTRLVDPASGHGVELWVDEHHPWLMLYTADDVPATARRSLAVEPMTAPADAFSSGEDLRVLEPGETLAVSWGIRAV